MAFVLAPTGATGGSSTTTVLTPTPTATAGSFTFTLTGVAAGTYLLAVKGAIWLRQEVSVDTTGGSAFGVNVTLPTGDVNGDNFVDGTDFSLLSGAYGTAKGDPNFNQDADLNGDGYVDGTDFALVSSSYGAAGTPARPYSLTLSPAALVGPNSSTATLTLSAPASGGGTAVALSSTSSAASVPASVTVPVGQASVTFAVTTSVVTTKTAATIAATDVVSGVSVAATLTLIAGPVQDVPSPDWAMDAVPTDAPDTDGLGPSSSEGVSLPAGVKENTPGPDLAAFNPVGPSVSYERMYRSTRAAAGYGSPGLSPGWVDDYDLTVTANADGSYTLTYPNGAIEKWSNVFGTFAAPVGAPYLVSASAGLLTMTFKDRSKFTFAPDPNNAGHYLLTAITNLVGHRVTLNYDAADRLTSIVNDASPQTTLLQLSYAGGLLSSVQDDAGRQVTYQFGAAGDGSVQGSVLTFVSQINAASAALWQYDYQGVNGRPYLSTVQSPNPVGTGMSTASTKYDSTGRVQMLQDAGNRQRLYSYNSDNVQLQVNNSNGSLAQQWTQKFGPSLRNVDTGVMDAKTNSAVIDHSGSPSPYLPSAFTNRNSQKTSVNYDPANTYGNVQTVTNPRTDVTTYTYAYPSDFPLGQVSQVQVSHGSLGVADAVQAPTTYDYYNATDASADGVVGVLNGLVKAVHSPLPGTTNAGSVTTSYAYDSLGNVTSTTAPGANGNVQVTYNYTSYGFTDGNGGTHTYTQSEALGEPVSATVMGPDGVSTATYYQYDDRGNRTASIDALGYETDYTYDALDEITQVTYPGTNPAALSARAYTSYSYLYPGGPLIHVATYDEAGSQMRVTDNVYGPEGELLSVKDYPQTATYTYDAEYRVTGITNGNGGTTQYHYDTVGNLDRLTYPRYNAGQTYVGFPFYDTEQFGYDADQNLIQRIDGRGVETDYSRNDQESLVTGIHYVIPAPNNVNYGTYGVAPIEDVSFAYDVYGRRRFMIDGTGSKTYTYDDLDNPLTVSTNFRYNLYPDYGYTPSASTFGPFNQSLTYTYNPDGSRRQMSTPLGNFGYQYDGVGRQTLASFPWGAQYNYSYYPNGWLQQASGPLTATTYAYNPRGFLTSLVNTGPAGRLLSSFTGMTYDGVGNRLTEAAVIPAIGYNTEASRNVTYAYTNAFAPGFAYDNRHSLTGETSVATGNTPGDETYSYVLTYDGAGNPATFTTSGVTHRSTSLLQGTYSSPTYPIWPGADLDDHLVYHNYYRTGQDSYFGDGDGNTDPYFGDDGAAFDPEDRLAYDDSEMFGYDGDGLRVWAYMPIIDRMLYTLFDGDTPVIEEDASGHVVAANGFGADGWRMRYNNNFWSVPLSGYLEATPISVSYTYDPQGNLAQRHLTNNLVVDTTIYDAFGLLVHDGGESGLYWDPVGFGGQWGYYTGETAFTGLRTKVLLTHRYYSPTGARFTTRDPLGYGGGLNLYSLATDNPVNESDPSGYSAVRPGQFPHHNPGMLEAAGDALGTLVDDVANYFGGDDPADCGCSVPVPDSAYPHPERSSPMQMVGGTRPNISTKLPGRVTEALPDGEMRTVKEDRQARNFFERNRVAARKWWEEREGKSWPENTTHDEHPRAIKNGGDPLFIEPGFKGPAKPHMDAGDFKMWGRLGGRPRKIP